LTVSVMVYTHLM